MPIPKGLVRPSCEIRLQHRISTDGQLRRSQPKKHSALCDSPNGWWADRDHSRYQILFRHVMGNTTWKDYINLIIKQQNTRIAIGSIWPTNIGIFNGQKNIHQLYVLYYIYICVCARWHLHSLVYTSLKDVSSRKQGKRQHWNEINQTEQNTALHTEHVIFLSSQFLASLAGKSLF